MSYTQFKGWAQAISSMGRPFLTVLISTLYNVALLVGLAMGALPVHDYITAVGPTNAMIIGFWFGERKSLYEQEYDYEQQQRNHPNDTER